MGYSSRFSLTITRFEKKTKVSSITVEDVINKAKNSSEATVNLANLAQQVQTIAVQKRDEELNDSILIERLRDECEEASYALDEEGNYYEETKWYSHAKDLADFSSKYPGWLFILNIQGEETGDIRRVYAMNGKVQKEKAKWVVPEFDVAKLTEAEDE